MIQNIFKTAFLSLFFISCNTDESNAVKREENLKKLTKDTASLTTIKWIDTTFDLGTISSGDVKELKFRFVNTGTKPLLLGNVRAGCGCTVPEYSKSEIAPGNEGFVTAKFNSKKQCGDVIKEIIVPSNAKNDSLRNLSFKANIINCESNDKVVPRNPVPDETGVDSKQKK